MSDAPPIPVTMLFHHFAGVEARRFRSSLLWAVHLVRGRRFRPRLLYWVTYCDLPSMVVRGSRQRYGVLARTGVEIDVSVLMMILLTPMIGSAVTFGVPPGWPARDRHGDRSSPSRL